jgi:hypothetical protein
MAENEEPELTAAMNFFARQINGDANGTKIYK